MKHPQFRRATAPMCALAIGFLLGLLMPRYGLKSVSAPAQAVPIAMPSLELHALCGVAQPRVWLPFRTTRHRIVPMCRVTVNAPAIRNQAEGMPSDVAVAAPMARRGLPNSLAAHSAAGPNLEAPLPGIWPVPFVDYPGASSGRSKCDHDKDDPAICKRHTVPEPASLWLMAAGVALLGFWRRVA